MLHTLMSRNIITWWLKGNYKIRRLAKRIRRSSLVLWPFIEFPKEKLEMSTIPVVTTPTQLSCFTIPEGIANLSQMVTNFNEFLHTLRSYELRSMPKAKHTMLSAGCSGISYFDWISSNYGFVEKHIGLEFYSPKPEGLSSEVEWVTANVQNMYPVSDKSVDLIFAGQVIEHLWPEELCGFLSESNRVLKDDGILVLDSPNREITHILRWSHPEHTIEYTVDEMTKLLELAGFKTIMKKGIWLCRDPINNRILPLEPKHSDNEWPIFRRLAEQHEHPEYSFCWWIEARKIGKINFKHLLDEVNKIYSVAFPERLNRLHTIIGNISDRQGLPIVNNLDRKCGFLIFGPYTPLLPGKYQTEFNLRILEPIITTGQVAIAQVYTEYYSTEGKILAQEALTKEEFAERNNEKVILKWILDKVTFGIQFRLIVTAPVNLEADFSIQLKTERL